MSHFVNLPKELDADEGELTRTRKLKRDFIEQRYGVLIEAMYADQDPDAAIEIPCAIRMVDLACCAPMCARRSRACSQRPRRPEPMIDFFNYLINGFLQGQIYALLALGFMVIYRASKVFNFAQGELMMLGAYAVWTLTVVREPAAVAGDPAGLCVRHRLWLADRAAVL
jgi:hypothetical protein